MQIIQFLVGVAYAALHSFISYTIPVRIPIPVNNAASTVSSTISSATATGLIDIAKKFLSRAPGEGGLAKNITAASTSAQAQAATAEMAQFRTEYQSVSCTDTSGQTFAIWLNVLYLAPLTVLFVRFFIRSYIRMASGKPATRHGKTEKAVQGVERLMNGKANGGVVMNGNGYTKTSGCANGKMMNGTLH